MTTVQLRKTDPVLLDSIITNAAAATVRAVPVRKRYARVVGISAQRASTHRNGDVHSPSTKFLINVATADGGNAWPIIAEGIAAVIQRSVREATTESLLARLHELNDGEHDHEAAENRSTCNLRDDATPEEFEASALIDIKEAEVQLERAAVKRELARRARRRV